MKLHTKLYLFFAGIVLLPLLVMTVAASVVLDRSAEDTYEGRLQSGLAAAAAIVSAQAQVLEGDLQVALQNADTGAFSSGAAVRRAAVMSTLLADTGAAGITVRDPSGEVVAEAGETIKPGDSAVDLTPMIAATASLSQPDGAIWRVTLLKPYDTESLSRVFSSQGLEWGVLEDTSLLAGSLPQGSDVREEGGASIRTADSSAPTDAIQAQVGEEEYLASAIMLPRDITSSLSILVAAVPLAAVGAASMQALEVGLFLMLGVAVMAGFLGFLLARNITLPLRELTSAAAAGIEGDLGRTVEVKSNDEIGSLASSFGHMQASLRDHIGDLEESRTQLLLALSYAGEILGSTSDRARMMKTTAEAARLATGASGVWVELFASNRPPVRSAVSTGVPSWFFDDKMKKQAAGMSEQVAAGSITAGEILDFGPGSEAVAYPMVHERQALGAMVAVFGTDESSEESRKMLGSLAAQAASAVENVNFVELQELLATTDPMTSLFNFRYLCNCMDKEISKSRRYNHKLSVAILDLDDFKAINDTFGHQAGDELLRAVGDVLSSGVRDADMVARYGGEEFSVVFPETDKADALNVVEKLRRDIADISLVEYPEVRVTASIGIAGFPEDGEDKTDLLVSADKALYRAKAAGKNRSVAA
ncbi:MAG: diguanylate cyclase [Actinobacteria bacterium]|nr:diguanylate cyclase [Actinomycetota bacterium]